MSVQMLLWYCIKNKLRAHIQSDFIRHHLLHILQCISSNENTSIQLRHVFSKNLIKDHMDFCGAIKKMYLGKTSRLQNI